MSKKHIFLIYACIIGLLIIAIIPKNADPISNATVNPNNGDIAFSYHDGVNVLRVTLCNKNGEELYTKAFRTPGAYAGLAFYNDILCVSSGQSDILLSFFDRQGISVEMDLTEDDITDNRKFVGWNFSIGKREYSYENYLYRYEAPLIFRDRAKLAIINNGNEKAIYESPAR